MNSKRQLITVIIKTAIDYPVALLCLIVLFPFMLVLAIAVKASGKGPVIFSQKRVGKHGKSFTLYKFRSMHNDSEQGAPLLSEKNDKRITDVGRFMRKHKFDEIPNLINVLKGEMSLIGPRPEQQYFVDQIVMKAPEYKLLENIKPGITSWGQIKYGYAANVEEMIERLQYDLFYLKNMSLWFDFKVAFHTIGIIYKGKGI